MGKGNPFGRIPWDLVVFMTVTALGFGFSIQRAIHPDDRNELASAALVGTSVDRSPAATTITKHTLDLGCLENRGHEMVTSEDGAIRVRGKFCAFDGKRRKPFEGVRIRNATTGYEGTVFYQGYDNSFVTDFLILKPGRNQIEVEWRDDPASDARTYVAEVFEK